jgi:hypothetical protein
MYNGRRLDGRLNEKRKFQKIELVRKRRRTQRWSLVRSLAELKSIIHLHR